MWVRVTEHLASVRSWDEAVVAGRRALFLLRHAKQILFPAAASDASSSASSRTPRPATARSSKKSHIEITADTYHEALFTTLQCLGQAHTSLSDYALARNACSESLRMAWETTLSSQQSHGSLPRSAALTRSVLQVIRALKRLGKAYLLEQHYTPALECFLPSLELLRSSPETEATLDCASVLGSLGFLYLKLKQYTESTNFFRECLRLYQRNGEWRGSYIAMTHLHFKRPLSFLMLLCTSSYATGVDTNDRETRKVVAWLEVAESREEEISVAPPIFLEIPTIVFQEEI